MLQRERERERLSHLAGLDVPSSGLILVAKTYAAYFDLRLQLQKGRFDGREAISHRTCAYIAERPAASCFRIGFHKSGWIHDSGYGTFLRSCSI